MPDKIPTQYEHPGAVIKGRQKLGVTVENPSLAALRDAYASEPSTEQLLNEAKGTLARTQPMHTQIRLAEDRLNGGDDAAAREQARLEDASNMGGIVKDAVQTGAGIGSFIPGPVGVGSSAVLAGLSGYDTLRDLGQGDYGSAAIDALGMLPAAGHAAHAVSKRLPSAVAAGRASVLEKGRHSASLMFPEELASVQQSTDLSAPMSMNKQSSIPPVRHYWDALDMGETPAKAAKIGAGRDKQSLAALKSLQKAGEQGRSGPWEDLTSQIGGEAPPPADLRSRAAERFGRNYRSEGGAPARSVPSYSGAGDETANVRPTSGAPIVREDGIYDPSGRYLAPLAGSLDDIAYWTSRSTRDPRR